MKKNISIFLIAGIVFLVLILLMNYQFKIVDKHINNKTLFVLEAVITVLIIILILISIYIYQKDNIKPEKVLLYITPIFCLILSATMPVGRGHDEYVHWLKAYEVSEGTLLTKIYENHALVHIPEAAFNIIAERPNKVFKYVDNLQFLDEEINNENRKYSNIQSAATYCFVQYVPQAAGIAFGRLITKVPLLLSYFGRIFNMITCISLMYFAIKNIPFGKNILLVISVIPIVIEGFSTFSADGITIAMACFFIAYTIKIAFGDVTKCGTKQIVTLTLSGAVLALCKFVYLPIVFLVLLIPKEKFKDRQEKVIAITLIILVATILNLGWLYVGSQALFATDITGTDLKVTQIINNPIKYIQKVIYTFTQNANKYFLSCFGGQLEWDENVKMDFVPYIMSLLMLLATFCEEKNKKLFSKKQIILILLIILVIIGLIFTSIFLQWTTDDSQIDGVQGRYFIPILPLIMLLLGNIEIRLPYKYQNVTKTICIVGYIVMIYTAISIMQIHI